MTILNPLKFRVAPGDLVAELKSAHAWRVTGLPATFIIRPGGHAVGMAFGAREWNSAEMRALLEPMLPLNDMGGPDMAPRSPQRSEAPRPGGRLRRPRPPRQAAALLGHLTGRP